MELLIYLLVSLPYVIGLIPIAIARTRPARIAAVGFALVSVGFGVYFAWGIANPPFPQPSVPIIGALVTVLISVIVTYAVDKKQTAPITRKKKRGVSRGCLLVMGAIVLLGVLTGFYLQAPHFNGSAVTAIDITMRSPNTPTADSMVLVQTSITNKASCAALLGLLRGAHFRLDHKCADIGSFTIRFANGKTETLNFLPGHDPSSYEFRFGGWLYRLPRGKFYQVLQEAGIDTAKMPESEH